MTVFQPTSGATYHVLRSFLVFTKWVWFFRPKCYSFVRKSPNNTIKVRLICLQTSGPCLYVRSCIFPLLSQIYILQVLFYAWRRCCRAARRSGSIHVRTVFGCIANGSKALNLFNVHKSSALAELFNLLSCCKVPEFPGSIVSGIPRLTWASFGKRKIPLNVFNKTFIF